MKIINISVIFLAILIHSRILVRGFTFGEIQNRERRQNNIYQFLRHVLASSSSNYPNYDNGQHYPEYSNLYSNTQRENVVVNVNQADSKPTTIINNVHPEYSNSCPCERYVRGPNNELECLCARKIIYTKCSRSTVCVMKNFCDHGLLFDTQVLHSVLNNPIELCDESTHTCCLPPTEVRKETNFGDQVYNQVINSTIDHLNNSVTKYIITDNVYLNNRNHPPQTEVNQEIRPEWVRSRVNMPRLPNQYQSSQYPPNTYEVNQYQPGQIQPNQFRKNTAANPAVTLSVENQKGDSNSQEIMTEKNPVQLEFSTSAELPPSRHTNPPNLVRPTRPPVEKTNQPVLETKAKELQNGEKSTLKPQFVSSKVSSTTESIPEVTTVDLDPDELASIFGSSDTVFPGLPKNSSTVGSINLQANINQGDSPSVGVSLIENAPGFTLAQMDFPQSSMQTPTKKPEVFLTGRIQKLRNNSTKNATSAHNSTAITKRINVDAIANMYPTAAPAFNLVQEDIFKVESTMPPSTGSSTFATSTTANSRQFLKACPSAMKCVQNVYCTPEGFVSTVPVILTREEEVRKNMLLNCGDEASGRVGKCCFDRNA